MIRCACCERRLGHSLAACTCQEAACAGCRLCPAHCTCKGPQFVAWPSPLTQSVLPGDVRTNMTYDPGPQADEPVVV